MSLADVRTYAALPAGSTTLSRLPFKFGSFERSAVPAGAFSAEFRHYAFIVTTTPATGRVSLNGCDPMPGSWPAGSLSVLRPGDRLEGECDGATAEEALLLCPQAVEALLASDVAPGGARIASVLRIEMPAGVRSIWQRLRQAQSAEAGAGPAMAELCAELLISKLADRPEPPGMKAALGNREAVRRATDYIENNLGERLDLKSIAEAAGLSPFYFSRVFRAAYDTTVHRYVLDRRLRLASELLKRQDISISSVALESGFSSQSHMTTAFRQRYGVTPAVFRQLVALGHSLAS